MAQRTTLIEKDLRFAEFVARTWLEPTLAENYAVDPRAVLAGFGLDLPAGAAAPALPALHDTGLVIEDLDRISDRAASADYCFCFDPTAT